MKIEIFEFVEGAKKADDFTVIIDVFRAFSTACYAFDAGASKVIATGTVEDAFEIKKSCKNCLLAGEKDEKKINGFDLGNSPTEIIGTDLNGKILVLCTTSGTKGLVNATRSKNIVTGSLVNSVAVARYIERINPGHVSLVAMGYRARKSAEEDLLCAEIIKDILSGGKKDFKSKIEDLRFSSGQRFFVYENFGFSPPTDFFLCTMTDRFRFVLKAARRSDGNVELVKIDV